MGYCLAADLQMLDIGASCECSRKHEVFSNGNCLFGAWGKIPMKVSKIAVKLKMRRCISVSIFFVVVLSNLYGDVTIAPCWLWYHDLFELMTGWLYSVCAGSEKLLFFCHFCLEWILYTENKQEGWRRESGMTWNKDPIDDTCTHMCPSQFDGVDFDQRTTVYGAWRSRIFWHPAASSTKKMSHTAHCINNK